jgi:hypothetical protein
MFVREYRLDLVDSLSGRTLASYGGSGIGSRFAEERAVRLSLDLTHGANSSRVVVHAVPIAVAADDRHYEFSAGRIKEVAQQI